ncbi:MAG: TIM barrel protein [Ilumatobacteraceae bacterium]|nr:TIM barrel protein [Ilumatobacteraceae bacterium]
MTSNDQPMAFGAGLWLFGQFVDRYATDAYGDEVSTLEAIVAASKVRGLTHLDINYPFTSPDISAADVRRVLDEHGMRAIAVTPAIYSRRFAKGSFTHPDVAVRREAIDLCKQAVDVAGELDADYVKFWPGQDGHDYPFQVDHMQVWDHEVEGIGAVVRSAPDTQFAIEYKLKEPRLHMTLSTGAKTLLAIDDIGCDNLGIVMDFGHSLFAKESPSEMLQLIHRRGRLVSVEINDNLLEWDDDLVVGSVHPIDTLEFLNTVRKIGWDQPILLDQFPFREDPVGAAQLSIDVIEAMSAKLDQLDLDALRQAQDRHDALATQRQILGSLLDLRRS